MRTSLVTSLFLAMLFILGGCSHSPTPSLSIPSTTEDASNEEPFYASMQNYLEDFLPESVHADGVAITDKTIDQKNTAYHYTIEAAYPEFTIAGVPATAVRNLNQAVQTTATTIINEFITNVKKTKNNQAADMKSGLEMNFHTYLATTDMVSGMFLASPYYAGSARPWNLREPFTYDLSTNRPIALADLFHKNTDFISLLSRLSLEEARLEYEGDEPTNEERYADFMSPKTDNFNDYALTRDGILLFFPVFGTGPTVIAIPWEAIKDSLDMKGPARFFVN